MADTIIARIAAGALVLNELTTASGGISINTASSSSVTVEHNLGKVPKFVMVYGPFISASSALSSGSYFLSAAAMDDMQIKSTVVKSSSSAISQALVSTRTDPLTGADGFIQAANTTTFRLSPGGKIAPGTLYWIVAG